MKVRQSLRGGGGGSLFTNRFHTEGTATLITMTTMIVAGGPTVRVHNKYVTGFRVSCSVYGLVLALRQDVYTRVSRGLKRDSLSLNHAPAQSLQWSLELRTAQTQIETL